MGVIQPTLQDRWKIKQEKTQPLIVSQVRKELGKRLFLHSSASVRVISLAVRVKAPYSRERGNFCR